MPFPIAVIAFNLEDVFSFFLDGIGVSIYYRRVIVTTLFSSPTALKTTFLVVLIFFASLVLVDERLL